MKVTRVTSYLDTTKCPGYPGTRVPGYWDIAHCTTPSQCVAPMKYVKQVPRWRVAWYMVTGFCEPTFLGG
eukprot:3940110-Rhodomonas_salina.4